MLDLSERAHRLLTDTPIGHLATAGADGDPHAIPICFVAIGNLVYSVIDEKPKRTRHLRRMRNIEESGRATLIVDRYDDDWTQLGWVMLRADAAILAPPAGRARGHEDQREHATALALLRERYHQYRDMALEEAPLLRLDVQRATEWWYTPDA